VFYWAKTHGLNWQDGLCYTGTTWSEDSLSRTDSPGGQRWGATPSAVAGPV